jgi:RNA-directed DNA polymerase
MSDLIAWDSINWHLVKKRVSKYQERIYTASSNGNTGKVHYLQKKIINSLDAKLLAVKKVTSENKGRNTVGLDLRLYLKPVEKIKLVEDIRIDGKAYPIKRVWIPKSEKKDKRPLGIPIIKDRAKQALVKLALEPEWEAKFEPNSYGFRPGRSCHDAMEAIFSAIRTRGTTPGYSKYVLEVDLKGCFDNIDHTYLIQKLNTLPEIREQTFAWLKAGIIEEKYFHSENINLIPKNNLGTPQGGILSPLLANIALHGMEEYLKNWVGSKPCFTKTNSLRGRKSSLSIIRYAYNFVLIHPNSQILEESKQILIEWFASTSKLTINEEKASLVSLRKGFDFLGWTFITVKRNGIPRAKIVPAKKGIKCLMDKVSTIIKNNKSVSSYDLITMLRPIIIGWANYHQYTECHETFQKISHLIFLKIRAWVFRRDKRNGKKEIANRYFLMGKPVKFKGITHIDKWILTGKQTKKNGATKETFLPNISWINSKKFVKVKENKSPFNGDLEYWMKRSMTYGEFSHTEVLLIKKQEYKCTFCNLSFQPFDSVETDPILPRSEKGKDHFSNLQLLHKHCHRNKTRNDNMNNRKNKQSKSDTIYGGAG